MLKKVWNIVSIILICALAVLTVLIAGARLLGVQPYAVLSGSMSPVYPTGALIYVKPAQAQEVRMGDPITFHLENRTTVATHRVISIDNENRCFYTKGDANEAPDGSPVFFDHLIGIPVFSIPMLGYISNFISTPPGLYIAAAVILIFVVLLVLPGILRKADERSAREVTQNAGSMGIDRGDKARGAADTYKPQNNSLRNCKE